MDNGEPGSKTAVCIKNYHGLDEQSLSVHFTKEGIFPFNQSLRSLILNLLQTNF